jgi:hypothetical protein
MAELEKSTTGKKDLKHLFLKKELTTVGKKSKSFQWLVLGLAILALVIALIYCFTELYA